MGRGTNLMARMMSKPRKKSPIVKKVNEMLEASKGASKLQTMTVEEYSEKILKPMVEKFEKNQDNVNSPAYYNTGKYETIDIIEDIIGNYDISQDAFLAGQVIKYLSRAPLKGNYKEDLKKAQWYLNRLIERNK